MKHYRKTSHVVYDIKYHICWVTKYRYHVLKGEIGTRTRDLIKQISSSLDVEIISGSVSPDHVHLLVSVPPSISASKLTQRIKGTTSRKLQQEFTELKNKYWGQHLWARGYFVVSSGNVTDEMWMEYIKNQKFEEQDFGDFRVTN
jgi:putative transposase